MNVGEELCGEWLRHVKGCEFLQYNVRLSTVQGELDVLGINLAERIVYACEVAVHLTTGLLYVSGGGQSGNVSKLTSKFRKDIDFVRGAFPDYRHVFMLWSPIVRSSKPGSKNNQLDDVGKVVAVIERDLGVTVEAVVNARFQEAIAQLRAAAARETKELDSSVMRFLQIEEHLRRHLGRGRHEAAAKGRRGTTTPPSE